MQRPWRRRRRGQPRLAARLHANGFKGVLSFLEPRLRARAWHVMPAERRARERSQRGHSSTWRWFRLHGEGRP